MKKRVRVSSTLSWVPLLVYPSRKNPPGEPLRGAQATAFLWLQDKTYFLITNWHNVTGWDPINGRALSENGFTPDCLIIRLLKLERNDGDTLLIEGKHLIVNLYGEDGKPSWFEHPTLGSRVDVVALEIGEAGDWVIKSHPINTVGDFVDFQVVAGDDSYVLGYPLGLHGGANFPIWKRASIASEPEIDLDDLPKVLIDTATRPGMSGSPVIAVRRGTINPRDVSGLTDNTIIGTAETFIGVYSGRVDDDPLGAQIGVVWKAPVIPEIINGRTRGRTPFDD
jgi:hypothetical protein